MRLVQHGAPRPLGKEFRIAADIFFHALPRKVQHAVSQAVHKIAVVRYNEQRPVVFLQCTLKRFARGNVEMVRRLVQQKQVRAGKHQF